MKSAGIKAVSVMQEVGTGALLVFAASQPAELDVSTRVLPLSLSKVFLAASWWDRGQPDFMRGASSGTPVNIYEMLVGGSDSAARRVALALRKAVGNRAVLADLRRYGFNRAGESFWAAVDPEWRARLTPQGAYADLEALEDAAWSSALAIGESHMMTTALEVSRFFQAVGNGGVRCAPFERRTATGSPAACTAPARIMEEATAGKISATALDTVQRGSARRIAGALQEAGWAIGGKTGTGGRPGAPLSGQDGWFAGLIFDRGGKPRYTVVTFVAQGGLGSGHAADISVLLARFMAASDAPGGLPR